MCGFHRISRKRSCHKQIEIVLLLPLKSRCLLFISLPTSLTRTSSTIENRRGKSRHPFLILNYQESFWSCDFFHRCHLSGQELHFFSQLRVFFNHRRCWILSNAFTIEAIICFLSLILFIRCSTWIKFCMFNQTCILGINSTWP